MVSPGRIQAVLGRKPLRGVRLFSTDLPFGSAAAGIRPRRCREDRLRTVFGLTAGQRLPHVAKESLRKYHRYLAARLVFPFQASECDEVEPLVFDNAIQVAALVDLREVELDASRGILCKASAHGRAIRPGLAALQSGDHSVNRRLIEDYWHWFWNFRN